MTELSLSSRRSTNSNVHRALPGGCELHVKFSGTFCGVGEYVHSVEDRLARTSTLSTVVEFVGVYFHSFHIPRMHCPGNVQELE